MPHNGSHVAAPALAIAYHSGFGHTAVLADAVAAGAREAGADVSVIAVNPDQVHPSDVQTCRHLGYRVALVTRQLNIGRSVSPAASSPEASSAPAR